MSFKFGLVTNIDPAKTLIAFVVVIAFIILFDYTTEILEYFLKDSAIYNKMVQAIYKELMIMGFLVFIVLLIEATHENASTQLHDSLVAVDFAHILIFFYSLFWVGYAFYLIRISVYFSQTNRMYVKVKPSGIVNSLNKLEGTDFMSTLSRWRYKMSWLPMSKLREQCEFHIIRHIFRALYLVPNEFDFTSYLSGCFKRYSLKIINRSLMSWLFLFFLVLCNYFRLLAGFGCVVHTNTSSGHRFLENGLEEFEMLGSSGSHSSSTHATHDYTEADRQCTIETLRYFCLTGALCSLYAIILMVISAIYRNRLMRWVCADGTPEYKKFFETIVANFGDSEVDTDDVYNRHRFSKDALLYEIHEEQKHEENEEEEVIRFLAESIAAFLAFVSELLLRLRMAIKVRVSLSAWMRRDSSGKKGTRGPSRIKRANSSKSKPFSDNEPVKHDHHLIDEIDEEEENALRGKSTKQVGPNHPRHLTHYNSVRERLTHHISLQVPDEPPTLEFLKRNKCEVELAKVVDVLKTSMSPVKQDAEFVTSASGIELQIKCTKLTDSASMSLAAKVACPVRLYLALKAEEVGEQTTSCCQDICALTSRGLGVKQNSILVDEKESDFNSRNKVREMFEDVFFFRSPTMYLRAVEFAIMFHCFYMTMWITNMITLVNNIKDEHFNDWSYLSQFGMVIPIVIFIAIMPFITETASILKAISDLDVNVVGDVLEASIEAEGLMDDLRKKMVEVIEFLEAEEREANRLSGKIENECSMKESILQELFAEIDADGSGVIDSDEFRTLLRHMKLTYSNRKFRLLFNAIDGIDGSGTIDVDELTNFVYPDIEVRRSGKYSSSDGRNERKASEDDIEAQPSIDRMYPQVSLVLGANPSG